jgi:hypothetical protein
VNRPIEAVKRVGLHSVSASAYTGSMADPALLSSPDLLLVFASAPAGLGHLRVTKALAEGLPENVSPVLLGAHDASLSYTHRIMSVSPLTRSIMEWAQNGAQEATFTKLFRNYLRSQSQPLKAQIVDLLAQRLHVVKTLVFVSTHFGLALQLSQIKAALETKTGIRIVLIVQVTDDSPQQMWYVPGADLTFVPSRYTKTALEAYGKTAGLPPIAMRVVPYPVSPNLAKSHPMYADHRVGQLTPDAGSPIHVAIPVSGAAVGTGFMEGVMAGLHAANSRFVFHIICKQTAYTAPFLTRLRGEQHIVLHTYYHDRETVEGYENLYVTDPISLELTKPSEQAFKTLLPPTSTGGSILLFSLPVGRQEWDNINFLRNHGLIPPKALEAALFEKAKRGMELTGMEGQAILTQARQWRGLRVPENPGDAAQFILWAHRTGLLRYMLSYDGSGIPPATADEVSPYGVAKFWQETTEFLSHVISEKRSFIWPGSPFDPKSAPPTAA